MNYTLLRRTATAARVSSESGSQLAIEAKANNSGIEKLTAIND
jgi:hypothetical protein